MNLQNITVIKAIQEAGQIIKNVVSIIKFEP